MPDVVSLKYLEPWSKSSPPAYRIDFSDGINQFGASLGLFQLSLSDEIRFSFKKMSHKVCVDLNFKYIIYSFVQ